MKARTLASLVAAAAFTLAAGAASAQTAAPAKKAKPAPSAASKECSRQADEQKLKGKKRKSFRSKCLKDMKKKAKG
ncbi:MAG: PsiF family protein [Hyphomicrobiaceae bacterium]